MSQENKLKKALAKTIVQQQAINSARSGADRTEEQICTVGPVIGKVTDTTARILIETNQNGRIHLHLSAKGEKTRVLEEIMWRDHVKAFQFKELKPNTKYTVTSPDFKDKPMIPSSFKTLPKGGWQMDKATRKTVRFGFLQGNKLSQSMELSSQGDHRVDLWRDLLKDKDPKKQFDVLIHCGNQVYLDHGLDAIENKRRSHKGKSDSCKWYTAMEMLKDPEGNILKKGLWNEQQENIRVVFRDAYREAWNYGPTKKVLANVSNLMIHDDRDVRKGFGSLAADYDRESPEHFIVMQALHVIGEYQYNLHSDFFEVIPNFQMHSFHSFGHIGVYLQDIRGWKIAHRSEEIGKNPFIGSEQWHDIEKELSEGGQLEYMKTFVVVTPSGPLPLSGSNDGYPELENADDEGCFSSSLSKEDQRWRNDWWAKRNVHETTRFLDVLFRWKGGRQNREVLLVTGHSLEGGWCAVEYNSEFSRHQAIRVLCPGAIASRQPTMIEIEDDPGLQLSVRHHTELRSLDQQGVFNFLRTQLCRHRSYAAAEFFVDQDDNRPSFGANLVEASEFMVQELPKMYPDGMLAFPDVCSICTHYCSVQ